MSAALLSDYDVAQRSCKGPIALVGKEQLVRMVAMQLLTWGTIMGAIGSAFLLAAVERPAGSYVVASPLGALLQLPGEPTQAGVAKTKAKRAPHAPTGAAASAPSSNGR